MVIKRDCKRCLIGLQKGVSNVAKGHLLQANWASFRTQLSIYCFLSGDFFITMRFELMFFLKPSYNVVDSLQRRLMTTERAISNTVSVN